MRDLFDRVSLEPAWHALEIGTGRAIGYRETTPMAIASVGKVPLTTVLYRLADKGQIDLAHLVNLQPDGRSAGTTGISAMQDSVTISLRDSAYLALTISDNAAADALWDATTPAAIAAELDELGLDNIHLRHPMRTLYDARTAHNANDSSLNQDYLDPDRTNSATPKTLTKLLELLWTDQAASAESCRHIRDLMTRQVWHERLAHLPRPRHPSRRQNGHLPHPAPRNRRHHLPRPPPLRRRHPHPDPHSPTRPPRRQRHRRSCPPRHQHPATDDTSGVTAQTAGQGPVVSATYEDTRPVRGRAYARWARATLYKLRSPDRGTTLVAGRGLLTLLVDAGP